MSCQTWGKTVRLRSGKAALGPAGETPALRFRRDPVLTIRCSDWGNCHPEASVVRPKDLELRRTCHRRCRLEMLAKKSRPLAKLSS